MLGATIDALALFGGRPTFDRPRSIGQLTAPDVEDCLRLVKQAFDARRLTNDGPIVGKLEDALTAFHQTRHCVTVANAALGLTMLIQLFARGRAGEVIMPAFSYRGLPHFAQWAGQTPRFCDVAAGHHGLDPRAVEAAISERTTSILAVCNCQDPGDVAGLTEVARRRGVPIFFDSVYAQGATYRGAPLGSFGRAEVFSLHATKLLNGFEGGYVTTDDDELADLLRWQRNFALPGHRPPGAADATHVLGLNAKLNEVHAAMALLSLERIERTIADNRVRYAAYREAVAWLPGLSVLPYRDHRTERSNYQMAIVEVGPEWPLTRDETVTLLRAEGAAVGAYYSPPLHRSEHCPPGLAVSALPVSEALARRYFTLPVGELVSPEDVMRVAELLHFAHRHGEAIAARMARSAPFARSAR